MIDAVLKDRPHRCIPLCVEGVAAESALKRALAALWVEGFKPNLEALNARRPVQSKPTERTMRVEHPKPAYFTSRPPMNALPMDSPVVADAEICAD